jgi:hypothetical protein
MVPAVFWYESPLGRSEIFSSYAVLEHLQHLI